MKHSLTSFSLVALLLAGLSACGDKPAPSSGPTSDAPRADTAAQKGEAALPAGAPTTSAGASASDAKPADVAKPETTAPVAAPGASPTAQRVEEKAGDAAEAGDADKDKLKEIAIGAAKGGVAGAKEGGVAGAASGAQSGALEAMKK